MTIDHITFTEALAWAETLMNALNGARRIARFLENKWAIVLPLNSTIAFE